jgi:hypothetical protein
LTHQFADNRTRNDDNRQEENRPPNAFALDWLIYQQGDYQGENDGDWYVHDNFQNIADQYFHEIWII